MIILKHLKHLSGKELKLLELRYTLGLPIHSFMQSPSLSILIYMRID